ncbi:MAG: hypothetical protein KDJ69_12020 [Nitratireductor sp.]|nr:hypothetical protein [Nitratireductor sp.]
MACLPCRKSRERLVEGAKQADLAEVAKAVAEGTAIIVGKIIISAGVRYKVTATGELEKADE